MIGALQEHFVSLHPIINLDKGIAFNLVMSSEVVTTGAAKIPHGWLLCHQKIESERENRTGF